MRRALLPLLLALLSPLLAAPSSAQAAPWIVDGYAGGVPDSHDVWGWEPTAEGWTGPGLTTLLPRGRHGAASGDVDLLHASGADRLDEAWFRYHLRFAPDFTIVAPSKGKLPGLAGLHGTRRCMAGLPSTPVEPCWSARTAFSRPYGLGSPDGPDGAVQLGTYAYHLDVPAVLQPYGETFMWDPDVAVLDTGRWYCIEGRVRMNRPGAADGVLQGWVDGRLALDVADVRLRRATEPGLGAETFWFDVYHGGSLPSAIDNRIWFDELAVGPDRVGCDRAGPETPGEDRASTPVDERAGTPRDDRGVTPSDHVGTTVGRDDAFDDDDGSPWEGAIDWLAAAGLTDGCDSADRRRYCPDAILTRGQAAQLLAATLDLPAGTREFVDVRTPRASAATAALAQAGATRGCTPDRFCPGDPVTAPQLRLLASRLVAHEDAVTTSNTTTPIDALLVPGCGGEHCPPRPVTRGVMAEVLRRLALVLQTEAAPPARG